MWCLTDIDTQGWFDFAERVPSGYAKCWPDFNTLQGYIPHSAVGSLQGVIDIQADNSIPKAVHGVIGYNGRVIQFLPIFKSPWSSGSHFANRSFVAFENEGGVSPLREPLTDSQVNAQVCILNALAAFKGVYSDYWYRPLTPTDLRATLYEHKECVRFGSVTTACPSGRIPWATILERLIPLKDGWVKEPPFWVFYNDGVPTERKGASDGINKGRISYNFGGVWWWERHFDSNGNFDIVGFLSLEEGD